MFVTFHSELPVMMFVPQPGGNQTLTEFDVKWRHWHGEVDRCLQDNSFASNRHLELICKVSDTVASETLAPLLSIYRYLLWT